jgi:hypothetical protein
MSKITREHLIIALLFLFVLGIRLFFTFHIQAFDYDAYFSLRQVEHIRQTGLPLYEDPLSYSGRTIFFPPFFYYLLAGFSFLIPLELAAKIVPCIGFAALVPVVYLITKYFTKNKTASSLAAFFSGFVPIGYNALNKASIYSFTLVLIFLLSYTFLRIEEKGFATWSIILTIILLLTHTSVFVLLISFLLYFLIRRLEKQKLRTKEAEIILFLFFLALWFNILLYKKAFFMHGIRFIWQNIPAPLLSAYFKDISFLNVISAVGLIPLLLGVYAVYHVFFKTRSRAASVYISFAIVSFLMLWLKVIPLQAGLLFLSMNLIILSATSLKSIFIGLSKTKIPRLNNLVITLIIILFILTTFSPLITAIRPDAPMPGDIEALQWLKNNTPDNSIVLGRVREGFLINYIANRKNVADSNFMLIKNPDQRYIDMTHLFTLRFESEAVRLINEYDVDYIFLSGRAMDAYGINRLFYAEKDCFDLIYDKNAKIYEFTGCTIE